MTCGEGFVRPSSYILNPGSMDRVMHITRRSYRARGRWYTTVSLPSILCKMIHAEIAHLTDVCMVSRSDALILTSRVIQECRMSTTFWSHINVLSPVKALITAPRPPLITRGVCSVPLSRVVNTQQPTNSVKISKQQSLIGTKIQIISSCGVRQNIYGVYWNMWGVFPSRTTANNDDDDQGKVMMPKTTTVMSMITFMHEGPCKRNVWFKARAKRR